ncbi:glycosyltransferase family 1 protein [Frigoribacterium sp. CFBP 13605]|uniref:glycosyltransferase family 4 protein n=1 Tax=Frigoribacterium sp. CFBP 13605 TaxID=2774034 RepID=UPI0027DA1EA5|nr:glycosyltransferase family 1 protein [Frigoribacterium sp. CFBP 13605]
MPPTKGGVARYIAGLLTGLGETGTVVTVVVKPDDLDWLREQAPTHRYVVAPSLVSRRPMRLAWEQIALPVLAHRLGVQTLHSPHYTFPIVLSRRTVVTLHDATFFSSPGDHSTGKRRFFSVWTKAARRWARAVVVPSASTAAELDRHVGPSRAPVVVAHHGVDRAVFHAPSTDQVRAFAEVNGLTTDPGWIAFLGTVEPRKSVPSLIEAHRLLGPDAPPLLVAGGLGWDADAARTLTEAGNRPGAALRHLGYLPLDDLSAFLGGASVVAYPSTGEGFGLPVLEAMATGAAVLTTRSTALPEVGGDAVAYAEATVTSLRTALSALLSSPDERSRLGALARERATLFTWARCALAHDEAYTTP